MEMIPRTLTKTILKNLRPGFLTVIYGPRRVGKTVLIKELQENFSFGKTLNFNGDTQEARDLLGITSEIKLTQIVRDYEAVFIDEAQRIPNISLALKIIVDKFPAKKIIVTGSTSLELSAGFAENLTGRVNKFRLFPLSTEEMTASKKEFEKPYFLEEQLLFGGYPYLQNLATVTEKKNYLLSLTDDYLFRDVFTLAEITTTDNLKKLARLLAFQIGSEVSLNELANNLKIDAKTVNRYLHLLKLSFVIFELGAFSRNLRKEVAKNKKYYFWDLGIRNALIGQFLPLDSRMDKGALWENFLAVERLKKQEYQRQFVEQFFWRTYDQAEIDWVEIMDGKINAYEFKWQPQKPKTPKQFFQTYKTKLKVISQENYLDFLT